MEEKPVVKIAAETWQPFFKIDEIKSSSGSDSTFTYSGIMWNILLLLTDKLNVDFEIKRPPDGMWGVQLANDSWNGMLGMIERGEVDLALGPFALSYQRTKVVDYPKSIFVIPHRLYLARPQGESGLSDFFRLFSPEVWWSVIICLFIVCVFTYSISLIQNNSKYLQTKGSPKGETADRPSLSTVISSNWGILLQESTWWEGGYTGNVNRFIVGGWLLTTLVLMNTYKGLLIATLTAPVVATPISSVDDLVSQYDVPWRLEQGGIILQTFKTADVKLYKTLLEGSRGFFPDCFAARNEISEGEFAAICDKLSGDIMNSRTFALSGKCEYFSPRDNIVTHSYSLVVAKNSPYLSQINYWLTVLEESGLIAHLIKGVSDNGTICELPPGKEEKKPPEALGMKQLWGVFLLLCVGMGISLVSFIIEKINCFNF